LLKVKSKSFTPVHLTEPPNDSDSYLIEDAGMEMIIKHHKRRAAVSVLYSLHVFLFSFLYEGSKRDVDYFNFFFGNHKNTSCFDFESELCYKSSKPYSKETLPTGSLMKGKDGHPPPARR
jgi:hypothetical protein